MARGAEAGQQAETQSQVDYSSMKIVRRPLFFLRRISEQLQRELLRSAAENGLGSLLASRVCLCKGLCEISTAFVCLPSIMAGRAAPNVPY